jgi:catechol 2,3-dioxygenase-like lactoylglutathione lyase family enzyme
MEVRNVRWVGIRTDRYEAIVGFLRDVLGLRINFEEPTTVEFATSEGDEVQVMAPGDPYYEFFGEQANGPSRSSRSTMFIRRAASSRPSASRSWARPSATAAGSGSTSALRTETCTSSPVVCPSLELRAAER